MSEERLVALDRRAPAKPDEGQPCNGCWVCCALECCPLAMVVFRRRQGPCPALIWDSEGEAHRCGLMAAPRRCLPFLTERLGRRLVGRWIAAGRGCDCKAKVIDGP